MQHDMIERLGAASRLLVVGDERQAIYGWRGASAKSLDDLQRRFKLRRMPLTVSFRCPENIIKHAQRIVPYIKADKPGGRVFNWEVDKETDEGGKAVNPGPAWFPEDFVRGSVVLCRNNAPLIKLGFAFIRYGIPCYFTGRDMAASLKKIVQALPTSTTLQSALQSWYEDETDKLMEKKKYAQLDAVTDRYEALSAIILGSSAQDKTSLIRGIEKLFMRQPSPEAIELSTIHKAKGKEWPIVYFLNEHLIPGRWVLEAYNNDVPGSEEAMVQEDNLRYVAVTRAMDTLVYFTLDRDTSIISRAEWEAKLKGESNE